MKRSSINRLLAPRSVALVGGAWADAVANASRAIGYSGELWRVHPKRQSTADITYYRSIDELPASDVLSSRQIDEWLKNSSTAHHPTDTDMGLSDEQLPLEGPGAASAATVTTEAPPAASA